MTRAVHHSSTNYPICKCQNCGSLFEESSLKPIEHLFERVAPGEVMPNGECPKCGAVCHQIKSTEKQFLLVFHVDGDEPAYLFYRSDTPLTDRQAESVVKKVLRCGGYFEPGASREFYVDIHCDIPLLERCPTKNEMMKINKDTINFQ